MNLQKNTVKSGVNVNQGRNAQKRFKFDQILIGLLLFIITFSIVASSIVPQKKYNLSEGDIATDNIPSPKDVVNEYATERLRKEAADKVGKVYVIDYSVRDEAIKTASNFFAKVAEIRALQDVETTVKGERLKSESPINLAEDDYIASIEASDADLAILKQYVIDNLSKTLSEQISNDENDLKTKKDSFSSDVMRNLKLKRELRDLAANIGFALIKPNMVYSSEDTEEMRKKAADEVEPVWIKKNQYIVEEGKAVTREQIMVLESLGLLEEQNRIDFLLYIGIGVLIALLLGILIVYLYKFAPDVLNSRGKLVLLCIIMTIVLMLAKFVAAYGLPGYIIPTAFASMLVAILMKPRLAIILNIPLSVFVTLTVGYNMDTFLVALISGSAGALILSRMQQRNDLITAGAFVSLINALTILGIGLINSAEILTVFEQSLLGIANGALSSVFTLGVLPFCETIFDIVTPIKLLELSNPNQPLLKKLMFEAPGTYHHSVIVGNLAEAAVDAVGGNSLLARVGAYYHDIGKIKKPYFFKENQLTDENPHDKINPSLSTLIITNHVKDGVELAKRYKLPTVVRDIIEQHHGTTLVKYFYYKAISGGESREDVQQEQFRYPGPNPRSIEAAIVMLADSVEASVRSISSPTKEKIEDMVNKVIKDKLDDGQLVECDLTLKDINKICSSFLSVLNGIYHERIEYPDDTEDGGEDKNGFDNRKQAE